MPPSATNVVDPNAFGINAKRSLSDLPPKLWGDIAKCLHPNEVAATLRLTCKAAVAALRDKTTVRLSEPVPPHAFTSRFGSPQAWHDMPRTRRRELIELTARSGSLANVQRALDASGGLPDQWLLIAAAGAGHLHVCQWLLAERNSPFGKLQATEAAARGGHLAVVTWLLEQQRSPERSRACRRAALSGAAGGGHRALCETLLACGPIPGFEAAFDAARGGHVGLTVWLSQLLACQLIADGGHELDDFLSHLLFTAVSGFPLPALQQLYQLAQQLRQHQQQNQQDQNHQQQAAVADRGLLSCTSFIFAALCSPTPDWRQKVQWLQAQGVAIRSVLNTRGVLREMAQLDDSVERTQLLLQMTVNGLRAVPSAIRAAVFAGNIELLHFLRERHPAASAGEGPASAPLAAGKGNLAMLQQMAAWGWRVAWPESFRGAAREGHLAVLQWLVDPEAGPGAEEALKEASAGLAKLAATSGNVEVLEWVREQGCPWSSEDTFEAAVMAGHPAMLERLASWGCPMVDTGAPYIRAAYNGDLATLRCLRRLGCPWGADGGTFARAVWEDSRRGGASLAALRCLEEEGCPVDWEDARRRAASSNDPAARAVLCWIEGQMRQRGDWMGR